jgi:hypothetical protein
VPGFKEKKLGRGRNVLELKLATSDYTPFLNTYRLLLSVTTEKDSQFFISVGVNKLTDVVFGETRSLILEPGDRQCVMFARLDQRTHLSASAEHGQVEFEVKCLANCEGVPAKLMEEMAFMEGFNMSVATLIPSAASLLELCLRLKGDKASYITMLANSQQVNILPQNHSVPCRHDGKGVRHTILQMPALPKDTVQVVEFLECDSDLNYYYNFDLASATNSEPGWGLNMKRLAEGHMVFYRAQGDSRLNMFFNVESSGPSLFFVRRMEFSTPESPYNLIRLKDSKVHVKRIIGGYQVTPGEIDFQGLVPDAAVLHVWMTKDRGSLRSLINCHAGNSVSSQSISLRRDDSTKLPVIEALELQMTYSMHRMGHVYLAFQMEIVFQGQPLYFNYDYREVTFESHT